MSHDTVVSKVRQPRECEFDRSIISVYGTSPLRLKQSVGKQKQLHRCIRKFLICMALRTMRPNMVSRLPAQYSVLGCAGAR